MLLLLIHAYIRKSIKMVCYWNLKKISGMCKKRHLCFITQTYLKLIKLIKLILQKFIVNRKRDSIFYTALTWPKRPTGHFLKNKMSSCVCCLYEFNVLNKITLNILLQLFGKCRKILNNIVIIIIMGAGKGWPITSLLYTL